MRRPMRTNEHNATGHSLKILRLNRFFGFCFAVALVLAVALAMIPNQFFVVSTRAVINAPVQAIASPITGQLMNVDLQVGQDVQPGQLSAEVNNMMGDGSIVVNLRLESLQLAERLKQLRASVRENGLQLAQIRAQIAAVKQSLIDELLSLEKAAEARVRFHEARLGERDAMLRQKALLVEKGFMNEIVLEPLHQQRAAALEEMAVAQGELDRQRARKVSVENGVYSGGLAVILVSLEFQEQSLELEHKGAIVEAQSVEDRIVELDSLIADEKRRLSGTKTASVYAQHHGRVVSMEAAPGDYLNQGGLIARSLDCSSAFVAAVYPRRDVAALAIGTPALVNIRSLGKKQQGRISKTVQYFNTGRETRYFKEFPTAEGHELYVIIEFDEGGADTEASEEDVFFGCHVGEEVTVSLGEPIASKISNFYEERRAMLEDQLVPAVAAFHRDTIASLSSAWRDVVNFVTPAASTYASEGNDHQAGEIEAITNATGRDVVPVLAADKMERHGLNSLSEDLTKSDATAVDLVTVE